MLTVTLFLHTFTYLSIPTKHLTFPHFPLPASTTTTLPPAAFDTFTSSLHSLQLPYLFPAPPHYILLGPSLPLSLPSPRNMPHSSLLSRSSCFLLPSRCLCVHMQLHFRIHVLDISHHHSYTTVWCHLQFPFPTPTFHCLPFLPSCIPAFCHTFFDLDSHSVSLFTMPTSLLSLLCPLHTATIFLGFFTPFTLPFPFLHHSAISALDFLLHLPLLTSTNHPASSPPTWVHCCLHTLHFCH